MDLFTLVARLTLDSSQFKSGIKQSQGLFSTLGSKVSAGTVAMGNLVSQGVGKAVGALVNFGKESVQTGISFEAAMDQVAAISGTTGTKFDALVDKAMEMGAVTKFSATESAEAFKYMAMAGWDADQMMAGIAGTMNLAAASGESLGVVSDIVTDVLTAMGKSAAYAGRFADVLAAASSSSNTNVSMMGETFKYAAPLAGALGYEIEDLALATGLMANAGIKGSQAGTSLRSLLTRFANPVKQSTKAMNALGLSLENSDGSMKSLREVMTDMRGAFADLTETQQAQYAAMLAGQEGMSGLLAIVNASDDDFSRLIENIDNSAGAAKSMAEIMMDNVGGSLEELSGAMETLGLTMFENLKTPLKAGIDWITQNVSQLTDAYKEGGISGIATAAGEMLGAIVVKITDMLPEISKAAGEFLGSFATEIGKQAPEILSSAGESIGGVIIGAINGLFDTDFVDWNDLALSVGMGFDQFARDVAAKADEIIKSFTEDGGLFSGIASALGSLFSGGDGEDGGLFSGIVSDIQSAIDLLGEFIGIEISEDFTKPISDLSGWWTDIAAKLATGYDTFKNFIASKIPPELLSDVETVKVDFDNIAAFLSSALNSFLTFIAQIVPQGLLDAFNTIKSVWESIKSAIQGALSALEKFLQKDKYGFGGGKGGGTGAGKGFAVGLDYVPYDNYAANLHRGEAVLTRAEAEEWRAGEGGNGGGRTIIVNQYINSEAQTAADLMREARWEQERGVLLAYV